MLCIKCVVIWHFCNEWHYRQMHRRWEGKIKLQASTCFIIYWRTRIWWVNWLPLATGPMIVASLALAVGSIGHSTGLVGRSLLLKKEYINWWAQITARSSYLHIHLKTLKIGGKIDWFSQVRLSYWSDFSKPCVQKKGLDRHSYSVTPILNSTSYAIFSKNVFLTNPIIAFA